MLCIHGRGGALTLGRPVPRFLGALKLPLPGLVCGFLGSVVEDRRLVEQREASPENVRAESALRLDRFPVYGQFD